MKKNIVILLLSEMFLFFFSFGMVKAENFHKCDNNYMHQSYPVNFKKVDDNYYRSGKINKCNYPNLKKIGIKTIIDLRLNLFDSAQREKMEACNNQISYFNIPMNAIIPPTDVQINKFFSIVNNPNNSPVLVHCTHGQDRTGIMTALYRVKHYHWDFEQAYKEMLNNGYHPYRYFKQKEFLKKYTKSDN